jgi:hypothetical protein
MRDNTKDLHFEYAMLTFDEMEVKKTLEVDQKNQRIIGPHKKMQMVMMRGLASS